MTTPSPTFDLKTAPFVMDKFSAFRIVNQFGQPLQFFIPPIVQSSMQTIEQQGGVALIDGSYITKFGLEGKQMQGKSNGPGPGKFDYEIDLAVSIVPKDTKPCEHKKNLYQLIINDGSGYFVKLDFFVDPDLANPDGQGPLRNVLKRDFYISSFLMDSRGYIYDLTGKGYLHFCQGIIDTISNNSAKAFREDFLKLLRAIKKVAEGSQRCYSKKTYDGIQQITPWEMPQLIIKTGAGEISKTLQRGFCEKHGLAYLNQLLYLNKLPGFFPPFGSIPPAMQKPALSWITARIAEYDLDLIRISGGSRSKRINYIYAIFFTAIRTYLNPGIKPEEILTWGICERNDLKEIELLSEKLIIAKKDQHQAETRLFKIELPRVTDVSSNNQSPSPSEKPLELHQGLHVSPPTTPVSPESDLSPRPGSLIPAIATSPTPNSQSSRDSSPGPKSSIGTPTPTTEIDPPAAEPQPKPKKIVAAIAPTEPVAEAKPPSPPKPTPVDPAILSPALPADKDKVRSGPPVLGRWTTPPRIGSKFVAPVRPIATKASYLAPCPTIEPPKPAVPLPVATSSPEPLALKKPILATKPISEPPSSNRAITNFLDQHTKTMAEIPTPPAAKPKAEPPKKPAKADPVSETQQIIAELKAEADELKQLALMRQQKDKSEREQKVTDLGQLDNEIQKSITGEMVAEWQILQENCPNAQYELGMHHLNMGKSIASLAWRFTSVAEHLKGPHPFGTVPDNESLKKQIIAFKTEKHRLYAIGRRDFDAKMFPVKDSSVKTLSTASDLLKEAEMLKQKATSLVTTGLGLIEAAANRGDMSAQNNLASILSKPEQNKPDYSKAIYYYYLAIKQGHARAQLNYIMMLLEAPHEQLSSELRTIDYQIFEILKSTNTKLIDSSKSGKLNVYEQCYLNQFLKLLQLIDAGTITVRAAPKTKHKRKKPAIPSESLKPVGQTTKTATEPDHSIAEPIAASTISI